MTTTVFASPTEAAGNGNGNGVGPAQPSVAAKAAPAKTFNDVLADVAKRANIKKIDRALAGELDSRLSTHKVMITVTAGNRDAFRKLLQQRGRRVRREHGSLNLFVADLPTQDVLEFANSGLVKALSLDSPIRASQIAPTVTVTAPAQPTVTAPYAVLPGATFNVTITNGTGNAKDWVSLNATAALDATYVGWKYLNGSTTAPTTGLTSATVQFVAPTVPGTYNVRLFANGGWTKLATSATVNVGPTLTVPLAPVKPGKAFTVDVSGAPGNVTDWVSLTAADAADTNYFSWAYMNGSKSAPSTALTSATVTFIAPVTQGTYNIRLFVNNTWVKLATSTPVIVSGAAPSVTIPSAITAGDTFTVAL
ncbi:MAG: hypothetical protein DMF87_25350, partial [Acidobacteria bacterium]